MSQGILRKLSPNTSERHDEQSQRILAHDTSSNFPLGAKPFQDSKV